jgi:protoheme IX farnesyltransferase
MSRSSAAASAYLSLTKPTIVLLFAVTGFAVLFAEGSLGAVKVLCVMLAMVATAGSANALNMYFDRDIDALMDRTKRRRPIPTEKVLPARAAIFGLILGGAAIGYFCVAVNLLAAFLSFFTIAFYVGIYTLWLKRRTPYNIVIGGVAGSTAPLIGAAAATGHLSPLSWVLFGVVFLWTPPHFWALAIAIQDEYAKAKVPMLPVTHGEKRTRLEILIYTLILFPVNLIPFFFKAAGAIYLGAALALGAFYLWKTVVYLGEKTREASKKLFWVSILYLFLLFLAFLLDVGLREFLAR